MLALEELRHFTASYTKYTAALCIQATNWPTTYRQTNGRLGRLTDGQTRSRSDRATDRPDTRTDRHNDTRYAERTVSCHPLLAGLSYAKTKGTSEQRSAALKSEKQVDFFFFFLRSRLRV